MTQPTGRILPDLSVAFSKPAAPAPASGKAELKWQTLDVNSLSPDLQEQYLAYKQAEEIAAKARKAFKANMNAKLDLPPNMILRCGFRYGKLAVALDTDLRAKPHAADLSLEGLARMIDRKA